ncbi:MAG: hypothetical protein CMN74_09460 [Sphingorhabdus sp.]|nr:hypothetical protein [Sphingorhabdus sp.]|tara:strand:- start:948 stop:1232 length:285 start_codon:yes stop_codon:yes gene_type:complete
MARPKPALPPKEDIFALVDAEGVLEICVSPGASEDAVILPADGGVLAVRTTAPPEDGKANRAVLKLLAKALGRSASTLELVRGTTSRNKLIRLL